jgi:hypothetical protein
MECVSDWQPLIAAFAGLVTVVALGGLLGMIFLMFRWLF